MKTKRIFFTGFMGAGKSTMGNIVANVLGWQFYDLDKEIVEQETMKVAEIFKLKGEDYFRKKETEILKKLIETDKVVISLGGGTIKTPENLELMKKNGKLIYLKCSAENIYLRLRHKTDRPLFQGLNGTMLTKDESLEKINTLLAEREKLYAKADIVFCLDGLDIGQSADSLIKQIKRKL